MRTLAHLSQNDQELEWLGRIPNHWQIVRLKHVCSVWPSNVDKKSYDGDPSVLLCNYTHVYYNDHITADLSFMSATATVEQIEKFSLQAGDVIITKDSETSDDIAIPAYVPETIPGVICGYHLSILRPHKEACGAFIKWLFESRFLKASVAVRANGLTRVGLGQYALDNIQIPLPPLSEQVAIADFLDRETARIDALVEEQRRLVELLREKRKAVISIAVIRGLHLDAKMKDSGVEWLGMVPEHWRVSKIKALIESIEQGWSPQCESFAVTSSDEWGVLKVGCVNGRTFNPAENKALPPELVPIPKLGLRCGDVLISRANTRDLVGKTALVENDFPRLMLSDKLYRLTLKDKIHPKFLTHFLGTGLVRSRIELEATGASSSMLNIAQSTILDLSVPLPPLSEQSVILSKLDDETSRLDVLISLAESAISLFTERRSALISAAVIGKIDVLAVSKSPEARPVNRNDIRSGIASAVIMRFSHRYNFGRVKLQKFLYLAETYADVAEIAGRYDREAAGPFDRAMLTEIEAGLRRAGAVSIEQPDGRGEQVLYKVLRRENQDSGSLVSMLGDRKRKFDHLLNELGDLDTKPVEAVTTLFAVWNDFLIDGQTPTDDAIVSGVLNDWHPEKRDKFTSDELRTWLGWMRRRDIVPHGHGPRTSTGRLFV